MGRTLEDMIAALPKERQDWIAERSKVLHEEVEGLKALRQLAALSQAEIARGLGITQPSVAKMERQTDLYLSTLRRFVEAAGGKMETLVELPGKGAVRLGGVGELAKG